MRDYTSPTFLRSRLVIDTLFNPQAHDTHHFDKKDLVILLDVYGKGEISQVPVVTTRDQQTTTDLTQLALEGD